MAANLKFPPMANLLNASSRESHVAFIAVLEDVVAERRAKVDV